MNLTFRNILALAASFLAGSLISSTALDRAEARQTPAEPPPKTATATPAFPELMKKIKTGSVPEQEIATALLVEYPDRVDEFAEPVGRFFIQPDESLQRVARRLFDYTGKSTLPAVEKMFPAHQNRSREENARWRTACSLIHVLGEVAREPFEPRLLELLDSSTDPNLRIPVIYALNGFRHGSPQAIEKVLPELRDEDFNISLTVCRLAIQTGPGAEAAVDDLRDLLANGNLSQRTFAAWALGSIGPVEGYDPLPELTAMLDRYTLAERERALAGIGLLGEHAAGLAPRVRELMNGHKTNLEPRAAFVLWQITGEADDSLARLQELGGQPDSEIPALDFLQQMGPAAAPAVQWLVERSQASDYSIRVGAVEALGAVGDDPRAAARIAEMQSDPHPVVRLSAKLAQKQASNPDF